MPPLLQAGIGLRAPHYEEILKMQPKIPWLEVHSENYFAKGGKPLQYLEKIREHYPLSLHGVGLSLGAAGPLNIDHLQKLKALVDRFEPMFVSEHLCWSSLGKQHLNDLFPIPYHENSLALIVDKIHRTQEYLQRQILIENISSYLQFCASTLEEADFIAEVIHQTGCGFLLDVNNLYINHKNHGWPIDAYLTKIPRHAVKEIHLAGHTQQKAMLIDTHDQCVSEAVWTLYETSLSYFPQTPTLIEWDKDIPPLEVLVGEARSAAHVMAAQAAIQASTVKI